MKKVVVSTPGKIHLLGEHSVVYGKPALLAAIDLRVSVSVIARRERSDRRGNLLTNKIATLIARDDVEKVKKIIESVIKKYLKIKTLPTYQVNISSQLPLGVGLGSSAAISAAYIAALLSFLKVKWDLNLINELTYEAEKVFHGNPSGGDNAAVIFGDLIWFRKETPDLKIIQPLSVKFTRLARRSLGEAGSNNFVLINSGKPQETTAEMVNLVKNLYQKKPKLVKEILDDQENLVRQLLSALQADDSALMNRIIRAGQRNLEKLGVVSPFAKSIIRKVEKLGGAAKISGAGGIKKGSGMLLVYHKNPKIILDYAKKSDLEAFSIKLGEEGLRK